LNLKKNYVDDLVVLLNISYFEPEMMQSDDNIFQIARNHPVVLENCLSESLSRILKDLNSA